MIRVTSISNTDSNENVVKISAFADTKDEVVSGAKFVGLDDDAVIDMGSSIITAAGELAFMKSDGTWSWVSSGGGGSSVLIPKTITQNGTYDPTDDNADGYNNVIVNVQGSGDARIYHFLDETYYMEETGLICTLSSRQFTKTYSDPSFVAYYRGTTGYTGPLLVSKTENGATYTTSGSTFRPTQETIDGETWYVSNTEYFVPYDPVSTAGYATKMTGSYATAKLAAEALLQLAYDATITENGPYTVPEGYDGFGDFNVDVEADTETLSVTQNGTYTPSTGKDGFSRVTVNVQGGGGSVLVETPVYARVIADSEFTSIVSGMGRPSAANAMGSDTYSWWGADSSGQHYLLITMPEAIAIKQVKFSNYWNNSSSTWHSSRVVLEGSNDNTTWDTLLDETDLPQSDTQNEYLLQNTTAYLYYKFTCYSTTQYYTGLGKVQLFYEISGGSGGSKNILSGIEAPSSSIGEDGDIYLRYINAGAISSGTQYIDTDIDPSSIYGMEFLFTPVSSVASYQSYLSGYLDNFTVGQNWSIDRIYLRLQGAEKIANTQIDTNAINIISCRNGSIKVNGIEVNTYSGALSNNSETIHIFAAPNGERKSAMKFYGLRLYDVNDELIHDIVAVEHEQYGVCLYDIVTETYFQNEGTGTFDVSYVEKIIATYCKVNGAWQNLIGTDIDDVNVSGGGGSHYSKATTIPELSNITIKAYEKEE